MIATWLREKHDLVLGLATGRTMEVVYDLLARMHAEEALREPDRRLASILEGISDGFFSVDREWRFTYVNGRAERIVDALRKG